MALTATLRAVSENDSFVKYVLCVSCWNMCRCFGLVSKMTFFHCRSSI